MAEKFCPNCGQKTDASLNFCSSCGHSFNTTQTQQAQPQMQQQMQNQAVPPSAKSKATAGILAILLGGLGIHKFYLGYNTAGIIMLLVTILGSFVLFLGPAVMGIIALIEGITYLTKSDQEFYQTYILNKKEWF